MLGVLEKLFKKRVPAIKVWQNDVEEFCENELSWEEFGMQCKVIRYRTGHLCGYVGISRSHPLWGVDALDLDCDLFVHGGITFASESSRLGDGWYWIGFDCAHLGDYIPQISQSALYRIDKLKVPEEYRDFRYVITEVVSLSLQLYEKRVGK